VAPREQYLAGLPEKVSSGGGGLLLLSTQGVVVE